MKNIILNIECWDEEEISIDQLMSEIGNLLYDGYMGGIIGYTSCEWGVTYEQD